MAVEYIIAGTGRRYAIVDGYAFSHYVGAAWYCQVCECGGRTLYVMPLFEQMRRVVCVKCIPAACFDEKTLPMLRRKALV